MSKVRVYKRGSSWAYRFEAATVGGKRQQPGAGGFRTKKEAEIAGNKAYNAYLNIGKSYKPSEMSYADLLDEWFEKRCPLEYDQTTIDNYEKVIRIHLKPALGSYRAAALDTVDFQEVINRKFKAGYSMNRLSTFKNVMSLSMRYAKEMGYVRYNPIHEVKLPTVKVAKNNKKTRKKERVVIPKDILQKIFERFPEGSSPHLAMMIAYKAGLRLGEVFALTWDDIDLDTGYIHVRRQIQNRGSKGGNKWYFKDCKYDSSRDLPIDSSLIALLRRTRKLQNENRLFYGQYYTDYYMDEENNLGLTGRIPMNMIMRHENGEYITPRIMQHTSAVIHGKTPGDPDPIMPEFDFHSLRHTHGTELAEARVPVKEIQARLGHKNIQTTLDKYVHETETLVERTRDSLEQMYQNAK